MPAVRRRLPGTLSLTVLLLAAACSDGPTSAPSDPVAITLSIVSGNTQSGVVGQELPLPLEVRATNPNGGPIPDLTVDFRVTSGGGSMYVLATATNSHGQAWNYWTLGTSTAELQSVEVRAVLRDGTKQVLGNFTAIPLAGPAVRIVLHAGNGQTVFKGTPVPIAPAVLVTDQYGNPVPNWSVVFAVASGGGSVTGASPLTDSAGVATVGSWTVGTTGQNTLAATAAGSGIAGNPVTFAATVVNWLGRAPMPAPRSGLGVGVVNGVLYAVGGLWFSGPSFSLNYEATVQAYDPATNSWSARAPMPTPRAMLGVGVVNGVVYAVGGGNFNTSSYFLGTVEAYDPVTNTWSTRAPMPTPRAEVSTGVVNGVLYAVGGGSGSRRQEGTVEAYDPATDSWSTKAPMPTPRLGMGIGVVNGVLYAVGGANNTTGNLGTVEAYDPATDSWSTRAPMPTPRMNPGVGVVNGVLYAVGGYENGGIRGTVEAYDPATNSWSTQAPMPTPRFRTGVGVVNGVLYAVGGYNDNNGRPFELRTVEAFVP